MQLTKFINKHMAKLIKPSRRALLIAGLLVVIVLSAAIIIKYNNKFTAPVMEPVEDLAHFNAALNKTASCMNSTVKGNATMANSSSNKTSASGISSAAFNGSMSDPDSDFFEPKPGNDIQSSPKTENSTSGSEEYLTVNEPSISGPPFISLRDLSALRSRLDALDVQVKIADKEKRLHELTMAMLPTVIPVQKKTVQTKIYSPAWPKIISIQGVDGRLTATLSSPAGVETVKSGSKAGPGKVISITPSNVLVRFNGKNIPLKFKEQQ